MRLNLYLYCFWRLFQFPPSIEMVWNTVSYWLNQKVFRRTILSFYPMSVVLYLTKRCNYKCSFCYAEKVLDRKNHSTDLSLEQLQKILDTPYGRKSLRVGLLGGEPFLNKDIFTMLAELKKRGKIITIVSNASLIDKTIMDNLLKSDLDVLGLSLYENNRHHVERVVKAINGKMKYWVQTVVKPSTVHEMEDTVKFALEIGCENLHFSNCVPFNGADEDQPIYEDNQEYREMEAKLKSKYGKQINFDWVNLLPRTERKRSCAMPFSYVHLDNVGNLGACCMRAPDGKLYGNIYDTKDAWNQPYYVNLRKTMKDTSLAPMDACKNCDNLHQDLYGI